MKNKGLVIFTLLAVIVLGYFSYRLGNRSDLNINFSGSKVKYPTAPITLTYWRTIDSADTLSPIIEDFKKLHPNVEVKLTVIPQSEYSAKLAAAAATGQLPDLFTVHNDQIGAYKQYAVSAPETVFTPKDYEKTFAPQAVRDLTSSGVPFALPYGISTLGVFYNERLLKAAKIDPPKSWQDVVAASAKLTQKNGTSITQSGIALGTPNISQATDIESILMMQNGAKMTDQPPTKATFDQPDDNGYYGGIKAAQFYASFATPSKSNYSWSDSLGQDIDVFAKEKTAMIINYPFRAADITAKNPKMQFKTAQLPQVDSKKPTSLGEYWAEIVSHKSTNSEIAWDFLRFASSKDELNKFSITSQRPASRLDLAKAQESDVLLGPFARQVSSSTNWYRGNNQNVDVIFHDLNTAILGGFDATAVVRSASNRVSQEISRSQK